jgi:hypothetical protein
MHLGSLWLEDTRQPNEDVRGFHRIAHAETRCFFGHCEVQMEFAVQTEGMNLERSQAVFVVISRKVHQPYQQKAAGLQYTQR